MKNRTALISSSILILLLAQLNLPFFIHICAINQTVSFLSSCGMHDRKPEPRSCCKKEKESSNITTTAVDGQCEVFFAKEHSTEGTIALTSEKNFSLQNIYVEIPINQTLITLTNTSSPLFPSESHPESPPIFLLDSNFRI